MDAQTLLQQLQAAVGGSPADIAQATKALQASAGLPGVCTGLMQIGLRTQLEFGVRQLALLVLRQHIRAHWTPEAPGFKEPIIQDAEKAAVRAGLPQGLADPDSKLRTAVGLAVAAIAAWDCPDAWPDLLDNLLRAIDQRDNQPLVHGALQCLSLFADELSDEQVVQGAPFLLGQLLRIVQTADATTPAVPRHALSILNSLLETLANLMDSGFLRSKVKALLQPTLDGWCTTLSSALATPLSLDHRRQWGAQHQALIATTMLTAHFEKSTAPHTAELAQRVWNLSAGALPLYEATAVRGETQLEDQAPDSDADAPPPLATVLDQALEQLTVLAFARRLRSLFEPGLAQLLHLCIGCMQLTEEKTEEWASDANDMLSEENLGGTGLRAGADRLLQALVIRNGALGPAAFATALQQRLSEADALKAAGSEHWWRLREAALFAAGNAASAVNEVEDRGWDAVDASAFDISGLLQHVLDQDLASNASDMPPFLVGRALWLGSQCVAAMKAEQATAFLHAAAAHLQHDAAPVQVGALKAVQALAEELKADALRPHLPTLYQGLGAMLSAVKEEQLHEVLAALAQLVEADPATAAAAEPHISPGVLAVWERNVTDPLVVLSALELMQALAAIPACLASLQERVLPPLAGILATPEAQPDMLVEGALDLLSALLKPSGPEDGARVHAAASGPVLQLLAHSDDNGVLQSCCEYWRYLLRIAGPSLFSGADAAANLSAVARGLARPLQPELGDSAATFVGPALLALLTAAPSAIAPAIPSLLSAIAGKLAVAESTPVITGLLLVVARLVHLHLPDTLACLASQSAPPGGQGTTALETVMAKWVERQSEFTGAFQIKLSATAVALLMCADNAALDQIQVKGKRLDTDSGPRTRSRAAKQAERWDSISLRLKLFVLTVDTLAEAQAQATAGAGNDSADSDTDSWEEAESDESDAEGAAIDKVTKPPLEEVIARAVAEEADDDNLEEADFKSDPVAHIDLATVLAEQLRRFAAADEARFRAASAYLTPMQAATLHW